MMKHRGNEWQWLVNELSLFQRPIAGCRATWAVKLANGLRLATHQSIQGDLFFLPVIYPFEVASRVATLIFLGLSIYIY